MNCAMRGGARLAGLLSTTALLLLTLPISSAVNSEAPMDPLGDVPTPVRLARIDRLSNLWVPGSYESVRLVYLMDPRAREYDFGEDLEHHDGEARSF